MKTKKDIVALVARRTGEGEATCNRIITAFLHETFTEVANGETVAFRGFGRFDIYKTKARAYSATLGLNTAKDHPEKVKTVKTMRPERWRLKFTPSKELNNFANQIAGSDEKIPY